MKFCPNCGASITEGSRFCSSCGTNIDSTQGENTYSTTQSPKAVNSNKKLFIGIGIGILIVVIIFTVIGSASTKGPEKTMYNIFKAIEIGDVELFLESVSPTIRAVLSMDEYTEEDILDEMSYLREGLEDEAGPNWLNEMEFKTISSDKDTATVRIFYGGDYVDAFLTKEKGKWSVIDIPDW